MHRTMIAFALLGTLGACRDRNEGTAPAAPPPVKQGPPETAEVEPNNDTKTAQPVAGSARIKASFAPGAKADEDWYRLDAPQPMIVRVEAVGAVGADITVEAYDQDRNRTLRATGPEADGAVLPNVTCTGSCWFKLFPSKKEAAGDYTVTFTTAAPTARSEREPNGRYVDAQPLLLDAPVDGFLAPADDEDWYLLAPQGLGPDKVLQVTLASPPDVRCELMVARQSDQAPLATYRAVDVGQDIRLRDLSAPAAPETGFYLVVRSAYVPQAGKKAVRFMNAKAAYTLEVKAVAGAPGLEVEPNDDAAHATPMAPAVPPPAPDADGGVAAPAPPTATQTITRTAFLSPKGDADWFTFHVDQPSIVRAEVSGLDRVNLVLSIIDPAKKNDEKDNELAKADMGDVKEPETLAGVAVPAGDNFIKVESAWKKIDDRYVKDYENPNETYSLALTVQPDDGTFEREPNDKPEKATPVEPGKAYQGFIQPAKDVDNWRLEVKEPTNVAITLSAVPKLDLVLTVKDLGRDGAIVGTVDKNRIEAEERLVVPFEPGSYLIEVREKGREANGQKPYTLTLK